MNRCMHRWTICKQLLSYVASCSLYDRWCFQHPGKQEFLFLEVKGYKLISFFEVPLKNLALPWAFLQVCSGSAEQGTRTFVLQVPTDGLPSSLPRTWFCNSVQATAQSGGAWSRKGRYSLRGPVQGYNLCFLLLARTLGKVFNLSEPQTTSFYN